MCGNQLIDLVSSGIPYSHQLSHTGGYQAPSPVEMEKAAVEGVLHTEPRCIKRQYTRQPEALGQSRRMGLRCPICGAVKVARVGW